MTKALDAALEAVSKIGKPEVVEVLHTPTPYHIESVATSAYSARVFICDANGSRVTDINCGDNDAKFIIRACNSHSLNVDVAKWVKTSFEGGSKDIPAHVYADACEAIKLARKD